MDVQLFLATQSSWLHNTTSSNQQQAESKRTRHNAFQCKTAFHISMSEQYGSERRAWNGAKAKDAVFIRLQAVGQLSSQVDASVMVVQQQQQQEDGATPAPETAVVIEWLGSKYKLHASGISKLVCSPAVYAAAAAASSIGATSGSRSISFLAEAAGAGQDLDFLTVVQQHVCLDLFSKHSDVVVESLARVTSALLQQMQGSACSTKAGCTPPAHGADPPGPSPALAWLSAAACEAQLLSTLVAEANSSTGQRQHHLLHAVGHLHASLGPSSSISLPTSATGTSH